VALAVAVALSLAGCGGATQNTDQKKAARAKKEKADDEIARRYPAVYSLFYREEAAEQWPLRYCQDQAYNAYVPPVGQYTTEEVLKATAGGVACRDAFNQRKPRISLG
jgi:hypothetical protein